jgi:uncharacterized protein (TIGR03435 family)
MRLLAALTVVALAISAAVPQAVAPEFEVATIKPADAHANYLVGFYSYPGGKVLLGGTVKMMVEFAFDVRQFQIAGGPDWAGSDAYTVTALPSGYEEQTGAANKFVGSTPSAEQARMIQGLLASRFGFKFHREIREAPVYFLERGSGPLRLLPPKKPDSDPRGAVFVKRGGIVAGEAAGNNCPMSVFARQLTRSMGREVIDRTGLVGAYDFRLEADDPENREMDVAVFDVVKRLGLKLRAGHAPVETIVIDGVTRPTAN